MATRRRYLTVSHRSLFILFGLFAFWTATVVRRASVQREAVDAIIKSGGFVAYYDNPTWKDEDQRFTFHLFHTIAGVGVTSDRITDDTCSEIARLPHVRMILLNGPVSERGLSLLTNLKHVESLRLRDTQITSTGFSQLRQMKSLIVLDLGEARLTDANMEALARLERLLKLQANLKDVSDRELNSFERSLPRCEVKSTSR